MLKIINKNLKVFLTVVFLTVLLFILVFTAGRSALSDLVGGTKINTNENVPQLDERLLDKRAPDFDLADTQGNRVRLSDNVNTPVALFFWSTWNQESADQIKILDDYQLHQMSQNNLIKIISIDSLEDPSIVKSFIKRGNYKVLAVSDSEGEVTEHYNIKSLPTTYFIDRDGIVREIYGGVMSEEMIVTKVENLLK